MSATYSTFPIFLLLIVMSASSKSPWSIEKRVYKNFAILYVCEADTWSFLIRSYASGVPEKNEN